MFDEKYPEHVLISEWGNPAEAIPTSNHDLPRYSVGRTQKEMKAIGAFVLTMPGVPFVYYGDENRSSVSSQSNFKPYGTFAFEVFYVVVNEFRKNIVLQ